MRVFLYQKSKLKYRLYTSNLFSFLRRMHIYAISHCGKIICFYESFPLIKKEKTVLNSNSFSFLRFMHIYSISHCDTLNITAYVLVLETIPTISYVVCVLIKHNNVNELQ